MPNANIVRVQLNPAVSDFVAREADTLEAFQILNAAAAMQEEEQREMTLAEALIAIGRVSRWIEAIG